MRAKQNNNGFSMVELIIVVAIMAILVGILTPVYTRYVERTKRITDCTAVGAVLDACEVLGADPDGGWLSGTSITLVVDTNESGHESSYTGTGPVEKLKELVPLAEACLTANWGPFTIEVIRDTDGHMVFDVSDDTQIAEFATYSTALSTRLE